MNDAARDPGTVEACLVVATTTVAVIATVGAPLIPSVASGYGVSLETAQWMLTLTLLVGVVATPTIGRLGDGSGRDRMLLVTLSAVLVGGVVAASARSFSMLLVGRGLQGIGYGAVPLCLTLAREHLQGHRQARAVATISTGTAIGAGLGFPLTGIATELGGYRAAFWLGAAISAVGLAAVLFGVPRSAQRRSATMDWPGAALLATGLGTLVLGVSKAETWGWGSTVVLVLFATAVVALCLWVVVERRVAQPLLDLKLLRSPTVLGANVAGLFLTFGLYIALSLVNRLVQTPKSTGYGFGAGIVVAGIVLAPIAVGSLVARPLARRVRAGLGTRAALPFGGAVVAATMTLLAISHDHLWELMLVTAGMGVGVGTTYAVVAAVMLESVPPERTSSAMSLNQVLRPAGGAFGSAVSATVLTAYTVTGQAFPEDAGYTVALLIGAAACLGSAMFMFFLVPNRPATNADATAAVPG